MVETPDIDTYLKRMVYLAVDYLITAAAFTLVYGEGLVHGAKLYLAMSFNFLALPIAGFTDFFTGLTGVEWFAVVVVWINTLVLIRHTNP